MDVVPVPFARFGRKVHARSRSRLAPSCRFLRPLLLSCVHQMESESTDNDVGRAPKRSNTLLSPGQSPRLLLLKRGLDICARSGVRRYLICFAAVAQVRQGLGDGQGGSNAMVGLPPSDSTLRLCWEAAMPPGRRNLSGLSGRSARL
jgi:hypothetical protein